MSGTSDKDSEIAELRQQLAAHDAVLASLATQLIMAAADKHRMMEDVFTEALEQADRSVPQGVDRDAIKDRIHELADRVQHGG
ncbi:hypothetical protein [Thiohalorhabdus sp.]|uniref:hypothetical protein n=1 Tax=Thiohalorhabdus sp. TaxID=3094134 RepID=UPI002FC29186